MSELSDYNVCVHSIVYNKARFCWPWASRLEMHLPNNCFHMPNKFSPDSKTTAIFHLPTYEHVFAKQMDKYVI